MIGSFRFNEIESESFKLVCKSVKRRLLPALKVKRVEISGSSGAYDFDDDGTEYSMSQLTMRIQYIGTSYQELRTRARSIAAWLSTNTWAKLIINDEPDKYYLGKVTEEIDLESLWESGSANVVFDCQPFALSINESVFNFNTNALTAYPFNNSGTRRIDYKSPPGSKFIIQIDGAWNELTLSMNGKTLNYDTPGEGTLIVDNVDMEVTLGGSNKFDELSGDIDTFLRVIPGNNILTVTGNTIDVHVNIKFIPLWL